jgi:hypothetical protein
VQEAKPLPIVYASGSSLIGFANAQGRQTGQLARSRPGQPAQPRLDWRGPTARVSDFGSRSPRPSLAPPFPFPLPPFPLDVPFVGLRFSLQDRRPWQMDRAEVSPTIQVAAAGGQCRVKRHPRRSKVNQVVYIHARVERWQYAYTHHGSRMDSMGIGAAGNASRNRIARRKPYCTRR